MHSCPDCGSACYCDMEDHENESAVDECVHACDPEDVDEWDTDEQPDDLVRCGECDAVIGEGEQHDSECSRA
jgi:hypothetical protein